MLRSCYSLVPSNLLNLRPNTLSTSPVLKTTRLCISKNKTTLSIWSRNVKTVEHLLLCVNGDLMMKPTICYCNSSYQLSDG